MARKCSICTHQDRNAINRDLIAGRSQMEIAREHGLAQASLSRHLHRHLGPEAARALARFEDADADVLGRYVTGLMETSALGLLRAQQSQDAGEVRAWSAELRRCIELRARLAHIIGDSGRVRIDLADMQRQAAALAELSTEELRALAAGGCDADATALPVPHDERGSEALAVPATASISDGEHVEDAEVVE